MNKGVAIFRLGQEDLIRYEIPLDDKERIADHVHAAYDEFRRLHSNVTLFDGVTVIFDKA